ncbi:MAG: hypothetical protein V4496_04755 [Pseudomonadota bacterium]
MPAQDPNRPSENTILHLQIQLQQELEHALENYVIASQYYEYITFEKVLHSKEEKDTIFYFFIYSLLIQSSIAALISLLYLNFFGARGPYIVALAFSIYCMSRALDHFFLSSLLSIEVRPYILIVLSLFGAICSDTRSDTGKNIDSNLELACLLSAAFAMSDIPTRAIASNFVNSNHLERAFLKRDRILDPSFDILHAVRSVTNHVPVARPTDLSLPLIKEKAERTIEEKTKNNTLAEFFNNLELLTLEEIVEKVLATLTVEEKIELNQYFSTNTDYALQEKITALLLSEYQKQIKEKQNSLSSKMALGHALVSTDVQFNNEVEKKCSNFIDDIVHLKMLTEKQKQNPNATINHILFSKPVKKLNWAINSTNLTALVGILSESASTLFSISKESAPKGEVNSKETKKII